MGSGAVVTVDTVSHEGVLEDQGRDPVKFFGGTPERWLTIGLDPDLDQAMRNAALTTVEFLNGELGMSRANALAYASADVDFAVSQVVDRTKGVHGRIPKAHFART